MRAALKRIFNRWVGPGLLLVIGAGAAWAGLTFGFTHIQELRQLERVPMTKAAAVLPGEVAITGFAQSIDGKTVTSFHTDTPSLYYRYTHEVERTDSDGDTHWETVDTREAAVDFALVDETGRIRVAARSDLNHIDWSVRRSFQETVGDHRYTEYRIEEHNKLFIFAKARAPVGAPSGAIAWGANPLTLHFDRSGFYTPLVSTGTRAEAQASMGGIGLFLLWVGLVGVGIAVLALTFLLRFHRLLVYLTILTVTLALVLVQLSLTMMRQDLANGLTRYQHQLEDAELEAQTLVVAAGLPWRGWNAAGDFTTAPYTVLAEADRARLSEYRINLVLARAQLERHMRATPERYLIGAWGFAIPPPLDGLPAADRAEIDARLADVPQTRLDGWWVYAVVGIAALLGIGLSVLGYRQVKFKRLIENIPTARSKGVSVGLAETTGTVVVTEGVEPLTSPHTASECTWFHYKVEERRRSGKKTRWVTLEDRTDHVAFYSEDAEGRLAIDPDDAEIISTHHVVERQGKRRYTETTLRMGDPLYAIGMAAIDPEHPDRLRLQKSDETFEPFILANFPETEVMLKKARRGMTWLNVAFSGVLLALLIAFGSAGGFAATDFLLAALAAPVYMVAMLLTMHYNDLVYLRERAERNWSNIEVSLKKRRNLIPRLERIAKRYLAHERTLLDEITQLRTRYERALDDRSRVAAYMASERALESRLIAAMEQYPELKADELMRRFMTALSTLETEIALLRQGYNDAVELFNTRIARVPDVVFAKAFGFAGLDYVRGAEP